MKSMKRFLLMLALVLVAVSPISRANAQGACGLAEADCKILEKADAAAYNSFEQDFEFSLKLKMGAQNADVSSKGKGVLVLDPKALASSDPTAALGGLKMTMDMTGAAKVTGSPDQAGTIKMVIVDGVFYADDGKGWQGIKLADVLQQAMAQGGGSGGASPLPPEATAAFSDPAFFNALMAIPNIKGFITVKKEAGPDIEGQKVTAYVYNFSVKTLFAAPEFAPVIKALVTAAGLSAGAEVTDAQVTQFSTLLGTLLQDSTITITRYVGEKDGLHHGVALFLSAKIDASSLGGGADPIEFQTNLKVTVTKIGQSFDVKAPAGAKMTSLPVPTPAK